MTAPQKLADMKFRTRAMLVEDPNDDYRRLQHVYWVCAPSHDGQKAAEGLYDVTRVEIDSCTIYRGQGHHIKLAEALALLEGFEKDLRNKGGQPLDEEKDRFYFDRMGRDYATARHFSKYDDLRKAEIARLSTESTRLGTPVAPMKQIRFKK